jgi:hypothetical protein
MRFIFNFIFFGILFYLIHIYFPDAFRTLVSWADYIYTFFRDLIVWGIDKAKGNPTVSPVEAPKEVVGFIMMMLNR